MKKFNWKPKQGSFKKIQENIAKTLLAEAVQPQLKSISKNIEKMIKKGDKDSIPKLFKSKGWKSGPTSAEWPKKGGEWMIDDGMGILHDQVNSQEFIINMESGKVEKKWGSISGGKYSKDSSSPTGWSL